MKLSEDGKESIILAIQTCLVFLGGWIVGSVLFFLIFG